MLRVIDEVRPAWVVGENVAGITTMVEGGVLTDMGCDPVMFGEGDGLHRYQLRERFTIERICSDLEGLGYSVQPLLIPAAAVSAPHRRDRVFIIACASNPANTRFKDECERPVTSDSAQYAAHTASRRSGTLSSPVYTGIADGDESLGDGSGRPTSHTHGEGRKESQFSGRQENQKENGGRIYYRAERFGGNGNASDTEGQQYGALESCESESSRSESREVGGSSGLSSAGLLPENKWRYDENGDWIPTVSPIHRGNDGLPFSLDDLAIPATKWRTESLKAYGNAIVPQVMYRIFQAIEAAQ